MSPYDKIHPIQAMPTLLSTQIQHSTFTNTTLVHHITHMCLFLTVSVILGWNDCPEGWQWKWQSNGWRNDSREVSSL